MAKRLFIALLIFGSFQCFTLQSLAGSAESKPRYFQNKLSAESKESIDLAVRELSGWAALDVELHREVMGAAIASEAMFIEDFGIAAKFGRPPRFLLVDSRLRLNPDQTGKLQTHQDGFAVQLEVNGKPFALFFAGFEKDEVSSHIKKFQATYPNAASAGAANTNVRSSRMPASEVMSAASGSSTNPATTSGQTGYYGASLWRVFKGCGQSLVNTANTVILYPVYALNSAKVSLVGGKKIDSAEYARDAYAAVFKNQKRNYKSAFSQSWDDFWANEARAAKSAIQTVANFEEVIAKGVQQYSELSAEEKQVVNCTLAAGGGSGFAVKAVANVALRTTAATAGQIQSASAVAKVEPLIQTPAVQAARARALERSRTQSGFQTSTSQAPAIKGLEVRELYGDPNAFDVPAADMMKIYGEFDPRKVVKAKEVPIPPAVAKTGKRYRAHLDVGDGHKMPVEFEIVSSPTPRGFVTIRFENPLHRGVTTERSMRQSEIELSPGFKELAD